MSMGVARCPKGRFRKSKARDPVSLCGTAEESNKQFASVLNKLLCFAGLSSCCVLRHPAVYAELVQPSCYFLSVFHSTMSFRQGLQQNSLSFGVGVLGGTTLAAKLSRFSAQPVTGQP